MTTASCISGLGWGGRRRAGNEGGESKRERKDEDLHVQMLHGHI